MSAPVRDWNADAYHRVSAPQQAMAQEVLDRLELRGDETVLDAGCGSGRVRRVEPEHPRDFLEAVCLGPYLARFYEADHGAFVNAVLAGLGDPPSFDYVPAEHRGAGAVVQSNSCPANRFVS